MSLSINKNNESFESKEKLYKTPAVLYNDSKLSRILNNLFYSIDYRFLLYHKYVIFYNYNNKNITLEK